MLSKTTLTILLLVMAFANSAAELKPFTANYEVVKFDLRLGDIKVKLEPHENQFIYSKQSKTRGLAALFRDEKVMEKSILQPSEAGLRVLGYNYRLARGDNIREDSFRFDSPEKVNGVYKNHPFSLTVPPGTLDRSSIELALMQDAGPDKHRLSYSVVEKNRLKTFDFQFKGEQTIDTPAGKFQCYDYKVIRSSGKRSTTLCLAPALDNLPIKITHNEKGTEFYMLLKSYQQ